MQEIAEYHLIFGYYSVTLLLLQVPRPLSNLSPAFPILIPMPWLTPDYEKKTPFIDLSFCPTVYLIWINFPTSTLVFLSAQTPGDRQATNLLLPAIPGMQNRRGKRSREGRKSCE